MIIKNREIIFRERMIADIVEIEQIVGRDNAIKGRAYVAELYNFCLETIGPFPNAYPKFQLQNFSIEVLRKATFKKTYLILYLVLADRIEFLAIIHASRDMQSVEI